MVGLLRGVGQQFNCDLEQFPALWIADVSQTHNLPKDVEKGKIKSYVESLQPCLTGSSQNKIVIPMKQATFDNEIPRVS